MDRRFLRPARLCLFGAGVAAWVLACAATAAIPEGDSHADARPARVETRTGRYCTPSGCAGSGGSPWGNAAGFGVVVFASGWIARRRSAPNL